MEIVELVYYSEDFDALLIIPCDRDRESGEIFVPMHVIRLALKYIGEL